MFVNNRQRARHVSCSIWWLSYLVKTRRGLFVRQNVCFQARLKCSHLKCNKWLVQCERRGRVVSHVIKARSREDIDCLPSQPRDKERIQGTKTGSWPEDPQASSRKNGPIIWYGAERQGRAHGGRAPPDSGGTTACEHQPPTIDGQLVSNFDQTVIWLHKIVLLQKT